jgi:hypothetical protein
VRRAGRFPGDQAEIVFTDVFTEQLGELTEPERELVLVEVVNLCGAPGGKHPLRPPLAGWNTLDVLGGHHRVVYKATIVKGTGLLEVLCLGPRSDDEVYDMAVALIRTGLLDADEVASLWDALAVLDVVAEDVGLDGWDYRPPPAPEGMVRAAIAAGVLDEATAVVLSKPELEAALEHGWGPQGPDPRAALVAALERGRARAFRPSPAGAAEVVRTRSELRCGAVMPRAGTRCARRRGHPGPHRSS